MMCNAATTSFDITPFVHDRPPLIFIRHSNLFHIFIIVVPQLDNYYYLP